MESEPKQIHQAVRVYSDGQGNAIATRKLMDEYAEVTAFCDKLEVWTLWQMIIAVLDDFRDSPMRQEERAEVKSAPMSGFKSRIHKIIGTESKKDIRDLWFDEFVKKYRRLANQNENYKVLATYTERARRIRNWKSQSFFNLLEYCLNNAWRRDPENWRTISGVSVTDYGDNLIPASTLFGGLRSDDETSINTQSLAKEDLSMTVGTVLGETLCPSPEPQTIPSKRRRSHDAQNAQVDASRSRKMNRHEDGDERPETRESSESPILSGDSIYGSIGNEVYDTSEFGPLFKSQSVDETTRTTSAPPESLDA